MSNDERRKEPGEEKLNLKSEKGSKGPHGRKASDMQDYLHQLLQENEALRSLAASLESEKAHLEDQIRKLPALSSENEVLRTLITALEAEKMRIQNQALALQEERDSFLKEKGRLQQKIQEIEMER